uniref:caspase-3-like n=1 Tax=Pristiophorus japonicus TaxID=55135 RepID=UPI00398F77B7
MRSAKPYPDDSSVPLNCNEGWGCSLGRTSDYEPHLLKQARSRLSELFGILLVAKMTDYSTGSESCLKPRVLIITVQKFYPTSNFNNRVGASSDIRKLHEVLSKLGFMVTFWNNYTGKEILQEYRKESRRTHGSCFISIISSHGEEGVIYGADGCPVDLRDIYSMFTAQTCPTLAGKPKIFFIQACRGSETDGGVYLQTDAVTEIDSRCSPQDSFSHYEAVPEDTAVHFCTSPDHSAFLSPGGSVFLQSLCKLLSGDQRHWELLRIMTRVNALVAWNFESRGKTFGGKKQMPCFITKLREEVYPFSDRLVGNGSASLRNPEIRHPNHMSSC